LKAELETRIKMEERHYKENLSRFVNHELAQHERQTIAEHLLRCAECRAEHDEIKLGATLAGSLKQQDAPANLWQRIENSLDGKKEKTAHPSGGVGRFQCVRKKQRSALRFSCYQRSRRSRGRASFTFMVRPPQSAPFRA